MMKKRKYNEKKINNLKENLKAFLFYELSFIRTYSETSLEAMKRWDFEFYVTF